MEPFGRSLLVLGGARSGKSRYAQDAAEASLAELVFIATGQAFDDEMTSRIARHQSDRDARWRTIEEPIDLAGAIASEDADGKTLLIDCLTLWASNLLLTDENADVRINELVSSIGQARSRLIFVANEVGLGIVPDNALARRFRDLAGTINQRIAAECTGVVFVISGIPMWVKRQAATPN